MRYWIAIALAAGGLALAHPSRVLAQEHDLELREVEWEHKGIFGTYDRPALQRGLQVYQNVCQTCHGLEHVAFRNLAALGYSEDEVDAIAAQYQVTQPPNDQGDVVQAPGKASDYFPPPYPNEQAAAAANGGKAPPDLSLMAKARIGGESYIYSLLTGYPEQPPADVEVPEGGYYNTYFPGHVIAMPPPLQPDQVTYSDQTPASVEQMAHDVSSFLAWTAEPTLEERKGMGLRVMLFLLVLTGLLYAYKHKIWADVDKGGSGVEPAEAGGKS
jgi:ubiquinol-cytochrome c reductase cytochrome c1 subunit